MRQRTGRRGSRTVGPLAVGLGVLTALAAAVWSCRTEQRAGPAPIRSVDAAPSDTGVPDDLATRPLYTFSEDDVDRYLRVARAAVPELTGRVVHLGRKNIGQPYEIYLLGEFPYDTHDPDPLYCLDRSDCLTFCEHMYAMALSDDWWGFLRTLQRLRYRDGIIHMLTRNHYTLADWDRNNAFLFDDLTTTLGGGKACVPLQQVCRRARFFARFGIGQDIPDEPIHDHYIPKDRLPNVLDELRNADFVNIIRGDEQSQYCGHTGLIALGDDGTVHFLHSARPAVREQPLLEYVNGDRRCLGVKILRLRPGAELIMQQTLRSSPHATQVSPESLAAALAAWPVMSTGAPEGYADNWMHAMHMQSYCLDFDTPVDAELQAALDELDGRVAGDLGIPAGQRAFGVLDLSGLRLALIRPDTMFYAASVPKICIVLTYFATHPEAATALDPQVERELQLVIKRSSNELAAKYSQLVGLDAIQDLLQSERYRFWEPDHGGGFWCGKHYGLDEPRYGDPLHDHSHGMTVRQALRYYLMLEQGNLESPAVCAKLKQIFAAPQLEFHDKDFVAGLKGRDVTVLRKGGLWEDWQLDTARIQHGDQLYLLAGATHHPRGGEYLARMAAGVDDLLCGPQSPVPFWHHTVQFGVDATEPWTAQSEGHVSDGTLALRCVPGEEATYESAVLVPPFKFNEVVASWNVDVPPGAGFCCELRVGRSFDDTWSPYLYLGDWGTPPPGDRVVRFDGGEVDVDYFRSTKRFDRAQFRLLAIGAPQVETAVRVARLTLCFSDTTGMPTALPRQRSRTPAGGDWQRTLPVPFRSQRTDDPDLLGRICSPTSVSMVLAYYGIDLPTGQVAAACYDPGHDIYGNWPRNVQAAYTLGVPGYLTRCADWEDVKRFIAAGRPVIASIRVEEEGVLTGAPYGAIGGHLIVITGFDADGAVTVNDPGVSDPAMGQLTYRRDDLEAVWLRARGGLAYILLPPD